MIPVYQKFIDENLDYIQHLQLEIEHWEKIYKKRVFEAKFPKEIKEMISGFKKDIENNIKECHYYMETIQELRHDAANRTQSGQDKGDVGGPRQSAGNTNKIVT
ncbi:MAG: hypothetical protein WC810_03135 [Janthinobacterium sp.]|jgi:hypothetical protein